MRSNAFVSGNPFWRFYLETSDSEAEESLADAKEKLRAHPSVHWSRKELGGRVPERIVSLVPSLSEALVVLGLGDRLVGVTEYCVHPADAFGNLPRLGGTKDADVEAIAAVSPDLVIANQEENTARVVRQLAEQAIDVWVTYPRTVREGAELLADLASLGASPEAIERHVAPSLSAVEAAEKARAGERGKLPKVFCPIWRDPWMTIGRDTYIHDMIELAGGENLCVEPPFVSGASEERPSGSSDGRRYPIVDLDEVLAAQPDVILLPDEPYAFDAWDKRRLTRTDCPAARDGRVHLIDGTLVSWYGPRIAEAIRALATIFANP